MEMRRFGRTDLEVSRLTFGCGAVGGLMVKGEAADLLLVPFPELKRKSTMTSDRKSFIQTQTLLLRDTPTAFAPEDDVEVPRFYSGGP